MTLAVSSALAALLIAIYLRWEWQVSAEDRERRARQLRESGR